ncbi:hypothetical protein B0I35DRAFT_446888 [Stachybotrys elegans]|uniref:Uncharacterized protein n=1 Tax=Stachybotrys elegans TaxID=80388 RepID=A0A8K0SCR8_9HYPO|nr:hypothetical protein B0I35DRAFT_446888 [Stachybotrys elegans]
MPRFATNGTPKQAATHTTSSNPSTQEAIDPSTCDTVLEIMDGIVTTHAELQNLMELSVDLPSHLRTIHERQQTGSHKDLVVFRRCMSKALNLSSVITSKMCRFIESINALENRDLWDKLMQAWQELQSIVKLFTAWLRDLTRRIG